MSKGGRKGRISNELVAASCAAILAVYGAGFARTRDEARRLGSEAQARRPTRPPATVTTQPAPELADVAVDDEPPAVEPAKQDIEPAGSAPVVAATAPPVQAPTAIVAEAPAPAVVVEQAPVVAVEPAVAAVADDSAPPAAGTWHDGYFTGWGQSPHGDIEAWITIKDGKIIDAGILRCETRYPCSVIDSIIHQPIAWQSPEVDRVSRATESADAYYWGLVAALKKSAAWSEPPAAAQ